MPCSSSEPFISHDIPIGIAILDYWRWAYSDLSGNINRAILGEFIVASALGITHTGTESERQEWREYDLFFEGIRVEVKTAAQVQAWHAAKRAPISFSIAKALRFDSKTGKYISGSEARHSDVYVFAVYTASDNDAQSSPLNLDLWEFYVVATADIDLCLRDQQSIRLSSLKKNLPYTQCCYAELKDIVRRIVKKV